MSVISKIVTAGEGKLGEADFGWGLLFDCLVVGEMIRLLVKAFTSKEGDWMECSAQSDCNGRKICAVF